MKMQNEAHSMYRLKKESEIFRVWEDGEITPAVSILCITYNHAHYIEKTMSSFLAQVTRFSFEVLIHDDASTDGTSDIITKYHENYPNIIKPIIQKENQYTKGNMIYDELKRRARGKYIAFCEGDDYWTDINKLQIQHDFLESHPDISVSGHDSYTATPDGRVIVKSRLPKRHQRDYPAADLITGKAWLLNLTLMYRNVDFGDIPERTKVVNNDKFLISLLGQFGGSHFHSDITPACHIRHEGGVWSGVDLQARNEAQMNSWFWIYKYYNRIGKHEYADAFWQMYVRKVFSHSSRRVLIKELIIKMLFLREIVLFVRSRV
ncbi:glycosyltransferase family 2 protein [Halomonas organivorans]